MVWAILPKVIQTNARFKLTARLQIHLDHVRMPAGNAKGADKTKGRSLDVLSSLKRNTEKAAFFAFGSRTND